MRIPGDEIVYRSEEDQFTFRIIPMTDYILNGVSNLVPVLFQLETGKIEQEITRPPIEIVILLDKSGSMKGKSLQNSKIAIKQVIENLTEGDRVHFLTYSSDVITVFENGDLQSKALLFQMVDQVNASGCTNMEIGINSAVELLQKQDYQDGKPKRIFLFSDGLVNEGKKTHGELFDLIGAAAGNGISTATFGLGHGFDEDLMKGLAERGRSDYFFIEDVNQIEKFVSASLGALLRRIGSNAVLKLRGMNGGVVEKISNGDLISGFFIGDIKQSNWQNIIAELKISPTPRMDLEEVMSYSLVFDHQPDGKQIKIEGRLTLEHTDDDALVQLCHPEVETAHYIQQAADQDLIIDRLLDLNKIDEAIRLKKSEIERLRVLQPKDKTRRLSSLIEKSEALLKMMESDGPRNLNLLKKEAKYQAKTKRFDSADWMKL